MPQAVREIKRRNAAQTKGRILAAAFELFADHGYGQTGNRDVAARAEVAPSLISRHFGSKGKLFEQTLIHGIRHNTLFVEEKDGFGARMARLVVRQSNPRLIAIFALAIADPESRAIAERVSREHVLEPLARWVGEPDAMARARNMLSVLHGFIIQWRYLSPEEVPEPAVEWLGRALQDIVDNRVVDNR